MLRSNLSERTFTNNPHRPDGSIDRSAEGGVPIKPVGNAAAHKLGPKANTGAINAGLRALDRTGKFKVRKWEKKGFKLRSFTGVVWDVPSWKAPNRGSAFSEDVKSDSTGSSDTKVKDESSAVSEKSGLNGDASTPLPPLMEGLNSSPAPMAAV